jgi:hypothetical protein
MRRVPKGKSLHWSDLSSERPESYARRAGAAKVGQ